MVDDNELRSAVDEQLGFTYDGGALHHLGLEPPRSTSASAGSAAHAQQALDALVNAYLARRIELGTTLVDDQIAPLRQQQANLQQQRDEASAPRLHRGPAERQPHARLPGAAPRAAGELQNQLGDTPERVRQPDRPDPDTDRPPPGLQGTS